MDRVALHRVTEHFGRHWVLWVMAGALIGNLAVIWGVTWLPMQDVGGHLELMEIMARANDPTTVFGEVYRTSSPLTANGLSMILNAALHPLIGSIGTMKVLLSLYVLGLPLATLMLTRAFDRPSWLALFSLPLVFNAYMAIGFSNFLIALPCLVASAAVAKRFAERGGIKTGIALVVLLNLAFLGHILGYLMALGIVIFVMSVHLPDRRALGRFTAVVASMPLFAIWFYQRFIANVATEAGRTFLAADGSLGTRFVPLEGRMDGLNTWGLQWFRDGTDDAVLLVLVGVWLIALFAGAAAVQSPAHRFDGPTDEASDATTVGRWSACVAWLRRYTIEIIAVGALAAYFVLPTDVREVQILAQRALPVALLFLFVAPRVSVGPGSGLGLKLLMVPLAATVLIFPWVVQGKAQEFERDVVGDLPAAIDRLPDKTALAVVIGRRDVPGYHHGPHWHLGKAMQTIFNGGTTDDSFAIRPYYPVDYRDDRTPIRLGRQFWRDPNLSDYDHVLLYEPKRPTAAINDKKLALRWSQGGWWLFDVDVSKTPRPLIAGGLGGRTHHFRCRGNETFVGMQISYGADAVSSLRGICRGPNDRQGRRFGHPGKTHTHKALLCPKGSRVQGFYGRADQFVRSVGLNCVATSVPDGDVESQISPVGGRRGRPFEVNCRPIERAIGFVTRTGSLVDALGPTCAALPVPARPAKPSIPGKPPVPKTPLVNPLKTQKRPLLQRLPGTHQPMLRRLLPAEGGAERAPSPRETRLPTPR